MANSFIHPRGLSAKSDTSGLAPSNEAWYCIQSTTTTTMPSQSLKRRAFTQLDTPKKNRIIGAVQFAQANGVKYTRQSIASQFEATTNQVDYALKHDSERT
jgi:hypothetical protein